MWTTTSLNYRLRIERAMTTEGILAIIAAVMTGLGGLIVALVNARNSAKKTDVENDSKRRADEIDALRETMQELRDQITTADKRIFLLQKENIELHTRNNQLTSDYERLRSEVEVLRTENLQLKSELEQYRGKNAYE